MAKVPPFSELIAATTRSAVHLETRDAYTPDDPRFIRWLADGTVPVSPEWSALVREHTARGVRFRRARVVSEPLTDYIRFEHAVTGKMNVPAGEDVRWLPRRLAPGLCVPLCDFWLFDSRLIRFHHFSGVGDILDDELCDDPEVIARCSLAFALAWERAIPHADYRPTGTA